MSSAVAWKIAGWICVALGAIGVFVPVMPTVPFLVVAAFCFERGSPELHRWLMEHKTFGPPLRQWREHRVIRPRHKALASTMIASSVIYVVFFREMYWGLKLGVAGVCMAMIVFILTRKSRPDAGLKP